MNMVEWQFADEPVSENYVEKIGDDLGVRFPKDYISCVAINHGANVEPDLFEVGNRERVLGTLLSLDKDNDEFIVYVYNNYKDTLTKEILPIGFDPAGNLICFDYKNHEEDPIVVFWEHEDAWEKGELMKSGGITAEQAEERARENVFYIADTFPEFSDKLRD